jgi:DNA invertase Pin-like site-specific DNA recombinase
MKFYAYVRVSTDQQVESGAGLDAQINACIEYALKHGQTLTNIFKDEGISGAAELEKRPALLEAISSLEKDDVLLVGKRDRVGRDPIVNAMIERAIQRKKAKLISVSGDVNDSNDPSSILMRRMVDAFAEYERLIIGARTKAALGAKKKKNERVGHIPFGHKLADDGVHLEICEEEQDILRQLRDLKVDGLSLREIAKELNNRGAFNRGGSTWNHASIHRIMVREAA